MERSKKNLEFFVERARFSDAIDTLRVVNKYTHDNLIREIKSYKEICDHGRLALSDYSENVYSQITKLCEEELALIGGYDMAAHSLDTVKAFYRKLGDRTLDALQSAIPKNHSGICPTCGGNHEIKPLGRGIMEDYLNIVISVEANLMGEVLEELTDQLLLLDSKIKMEVENSLDNNN